MDSGEYEIMYGAEDRHWWYQGMATITRAILARWAHPTSNLKILDAGCGTGAAMTTYLADYGTVTGCDIHPRLPSIFAASGMPGVSPARLFRTCHLPPHYLTLLPVLMFSTNARSRAISPRFGSFTASWFPVDGSFCAFRHMTGCAAGMTGWFTPAEGIQYAWSLTCSQKADS